MQQSYEDIIKLSFQHPIIVFDGVCNLCNGFIQWLIKRDKQRKFRYIMLQSDFGRKLIEVSDIKKETVFLIEKGKVYALSDVGLHSMRILGGGWRIISWFRIVPRFIRDRLYHWISRNRYRWFGSQSECMIPSPEIKALFI